MRVAVAGAGIAGLASSLTLADAGHEVTLYERRTGFGETGAGIQLSPNATRVLFARGLGTALTRVGCEPERIVTRSLTSGRTIGAVALGPWMRNRFGAPFIAVARSDLHTALLDAVRSRPNVRVRIGRGVVALAETPLGIDVTTEASGGRETATADLLVGADGLWSSVRTLIGDARRPSYSGHAAYRATVPSAGLPAAFGRNETGLWLGPGRHVVHYPITSGRLVNIVVVARRRDPIAGWSGVEEGNRVLAALADASSELRELASGATAWAAWSLYDLPARFLSKGRVALVGDAAHPVLPYLAQGGSLAIEDVAQLAAYLGTEPDTVPEALGRYRRERYRRVRKVQATARRNGALYHASAPLAFARDLVMRRLGPAGMSERFAWLYGWRVEGRSADTA